MKKNYEHPLSEVFFLKLDSALLAGSVDSVDPMNPQTGSWIDDPGVDFLF